MICSISGQPANNPVISPQGNVFERSLAEAYINEHGTEPITGEPISVDNLIPVKTASVVTPRPSNLTSIPSLLAAFQSEWDSMALEVFSLKKQLLDSRKQLSSALYHNDAAVRVVARLTKERDEARESLAKLAASLGVEPHTNGVNQHQADMDIDGTNQPDNDEANDKEKGSTVSLLPFATSIVAKKKELSSARKAGAFKVDPNSYVSTEQVPTFSEVAKTKQLLTNVSQLASVAGHESLVVSGGGKNTAAVFDSESQALVSTVSTKGIVTAVASFYDNEEDKEVIITGLKTGQVQVFHKSAGGTYEEASTCAAHAKSVPSVDLAVLPYNGIVISAGKDGSWSVVDHINDQVYTYPTGSSGVTSVAVHPDGGLAAIGTNDGKILIYDLTDELSEPAATFESSSEADDGPVTSLSFAENGKWLASTSGIAGLVRIWNLRTVDLKETVEFESLSGAEIHSVLFDKSSDLLLAASSKGIDIASYGKAEKAFIAVGLGITDSAIDATWGPDAKSIISVSSKGTFHIYGVK